MDPVLSLADARLSADPGGQARTRVTVRNVGQAPAQYRLEVLGEAARWATVTPHHVSVLPGMSEERAIDVAFHPPPAPTAPAGTIPFGIRCVLVENSDVAAVVEGTVVVSPLQDLDVQLKPDGARGARNGRFRVELHNTGTTDLTVALDVADAAGLLRFALAPREVTLAPDEVVGCYVAAQARSPRAFGATISHPFTVSYRESGSARTGEVTGTYEQRARIRKELVLLALLPIVLIVAGYVWLRSQGGSIALKDSPPPAVVLETVEPGAGSVRLVWTRSAYTTGYDLEQLGQDGSVTDSSRVEEQDQTSFVWSGRQAGTQCYRVRAASESSEPGPFTDVHCVDVLAAGSTPTSPAGPSTPPIAGATSFEPVGFYVLYRSFALNDTVNLPAAQQLVTDLTNAGAQGVQMRDSRDSEAFADGPNTTGYMVVFKDGFATSAEATAECDAYRAVAQSCIVLESPT